MNIYQSEFLTINKKGETLIQSWTEKDLNVEDYKHELNNFMDLFHVLKPKELLLDIKNCKLIIPEALDSWMAEKVLIPIHKKGIKKLDLTIADNTAVHLSIAESLEKAKPIVQSSYYSCLNEVYSKQQKSPSIPEFTFDTNANAVEVNMKIDFNDLPKFLTSMKQIESDNQFVQAHIKYYYTLTIREIEIFRLIALGLTNKEISANLFIEESSVKTHRKHIKKKLKITSHFDIYQYARCFHLI